MVVETINILVKLQRLNVVLAQDERLVLLLPEGLVEFVEERKEAKRNKLNRDFLCNMIMYAVPHVTSLVPFLKYISHPGNLALYFLHFVACSEFAGSTTATNIQAFIHFCCKIKREATGTDAKRVQ